MADPVLGVVGATGGVGASTFAAVLATVTRRAMLVDLDVFGGGIDVLLGIEDLAGARWSALRVSGGRLDPMSLTDGLPRWGHVPVLAADTAPDSAAAVTQVLDAAASLGPVVVDLGRSASASRQAAVRRCALVLLVAVAEVRGLIAARAVAASLSGSRTGLVLRRGSLSGNEAAALTDTPLIGVVAPRPSTRDRVLDARRPPRTLARVASGVLDAVAS
jgi:secretion/DNA translocation related CpaE-like protein